MVLLAAHAALTLSACSDVPTNPNKRPGTDPSTTLTNTNPEPTTEEPQPLPTNVSLTGSVTVLPVAFGPGGAVTELAWDQVGGGEFPFGGLWISAFTVDPVTEQPNYLDQIAILDPSIAANPFELSFSADGPVYVQVVLDEAGDGVIGVAEPSALLALTEDQTTADLFVNVPWDGGPALALAGGLALSGEAEVEPKVGADCAVMLFSANWYGPYFVGYFDAVMGEETPWVLQALEDQGEMLLSGACDANANGLLDPADAWGTWTEGGVDMNPIALGDDALTDLHLDIPFSGAPSTAEPFVTLTGSVLNPETLPPTAVVYLVAQRGAYEPDLGTLDHEYAWRALEVADLQQGAEFDLVPSAYKEVWLWMWVDLDADGDINESGEPAGLTGPWYTDTSHQGLTIELNPAL